MLVQGLKVRAIWDTGAQVTLMDASLTNSDNFDNAFPPLPLPSISLVSASGTPLQVQGYGLLRFQTPSGHLFFRPTFLIRNLPTPLLIGIDTMKQEGVTINTASNHISFNPSPDPSPPAQVLTVSKSRTIPARSELTLTCSVPPQLHSQELLVSPLLLHADLVVSEGIYTADRCVTIVVSNPSHWPVSISRGTALAEASIFSESSVHSLSTVFAASSSAPSSAPHHKVPVSLDHIPNPFKARFRALISDFPDIFSDDTADIGHCDVIKQRITLKDPSKVVCTPPYRIPDALKPVVHAFVDKLLNANIIRRSTSPYSSPLLLVKKPHPDPSAPLVEQYRVVNDFRRLNSNTIKDSYPMQNIYELIDDVANAKVVSVIDLKNAFWIQELEESSRKYTSFPVPGRGLFEFTRSAQGLCNSSASFQKLLDHVMQDIPNVKTYIDDIVLFDNSLDDHLLTLQRVFEKFRQYGFKCSGTKLQLACGKITYLGYEIVPGSSIRPGEAKTEAIRAWQPPSDVKGVRQFLGLCSFFRRTIPNFASIASPLNHLTRKDSSWSSGPLPPAALTAFRTLQSQLITRPTLTPVDMNRPFILTCDASSTALAAVLSQEKDGLERPCAFASRSLNPREAKLPSFHLEQLAIKFACDHFRPYVLGKPLTIRTDHKPLLSMNNIQGAAFDRLRAEIEEYQPFKVEFMKGRSMFADGLSRQPPSPPALGPQAHIFSLHLSSANIIEAQKEDVLAKGIAVHLLYDSLPDDHALARTIAKLSPSCSLHDGILLHSGKVYAPLSIRHSILALAHDSPLAGHHNARSTARAIKASWYWPSLSRDVSAYCRQCHECAKVNLSHHSRPSPLQALPPLSHSFERVHVDLLQLPKSKTGFKYLVVMVDAFSKWIETVPIPDKTADAVAHAFITGWVCRHGVPDSIFTDKGTEFENQMFKAILDFLRCDLYHSTPAHPASNGAVERVNRDIINYFKKFIPQGSEWDRHVPFMVAAHNMAPHSSTGTSPFVMLYLNDPVLPLTAIKTSPRNYAENFLGEMTNRLVLAYSSVADHLSLAHQRMKRAHDNRARTRSFQVGDRVYLSAMAQTNKPKKFQDAYDGPFTVVKLHSPFVATIRKNKDAKLFKVNVERLKLVPFVDLFIDDRSRSLFRTADTPTHDPLIPSSPPLIASPASPAPILPAFQPAAAQLAPPAAPSPPAPATRRYNLRPRNIMLTVASRPRPRKRNRKTRRHSTPSQYSPSYKTKRHPSPAPIALGLRYPEALYFHDDDSAPSTDDEDDWSSTSDSGKSESDSDDFHTPNPPPSAPRRTFFPLRPTQKGFSRVPFQIFTRRSAH